MRILFLCPLSYIGSMAFAHEPIVEFARRGHRVDVVAPAQADPPVGFASCNVRIFPFHRTTTALRALHVGFFGQAWKQARGNQYDLVVGLSQVGLIAAWQISRWIGVRYVFFNDELWFGNERTTASGRIYGRALKCIERKANRDALFTVTQDARRGRVLSLANHIPPTRIRYVPNSRAGSASSVSSTYLHQRLGIPSGDQVILWLGGLALQWGQLRLAHEAQQWPEPLRLVFHLGRNKLDGPRQRLLTCHGRGRVHVSSGALSYGEVERLAQGATIGLGLYDDEGVNTRLMGAASGKINLYLQSGVPCIVNNYRGLRWLQDCGAGICVEDTRDVFPAAQSILSDLAGYRQRALEAFRTHVNFDRSFQAIAEEIEGVVFRRPSAAPPPHSTEPDGPRAGPNISNPAAETK